MNVLFQIHSIFGERVLPLLIVLAAIFLTVTYKPDAPRSLVARIFPVLVDLQVTLGIVYWVFLLFNTTGAAQARYLGFPFILHPILGILAAGIAHMAVGPKNPLRSLGRWAPLASLAILLVIVLTTVVVGIQA
jgi:Na+-transporting NADH:ubiquinone oxidoreductase subunit NqrB